MHLPSDLLHRHPLGHLPGQGIYFINRKRKMLLGLPISDHKKCMRFRRFLNVSLDQNPHVAITTVPQWEKGDGMTSVMVKESLGIYIFVVSPDSEGALVNSKGTFIHVGSCSEGLIALVSFHRSDSDAFMGGSLTVIDVLYYKENLLYKSYEERSKFIPNVLDTKIPTRYKLLKPEDQGEKLFLTQT
jgi:hypothetical protein